MNNLTPGLVLLTVGSLSFLAGCSARVWRPDESRYRIGAIIFGVICVTMGVLGLLGYIEISD